MQIVIINGSPRKNGATAARLCADIRRKKTYPLQKTLHHVICSVGIRPFVRSQGKAYQGVNANNLRFSVNL
ncbi:MAG TPA: hypothetical protein DCG49_10605 [Ruminococcus sp.]|nr:hypothetical protein [Ruminococcus sp.]